MRKTATRKRPYFTMESAMTAILRDASGKMHHGILFARRLICLKNWNFEILHFQSGKTLWWNIFENHNQSFQRISFFEKTAKKWNAAPRHIVAGLKPLNFTIFKALGKKGGWRKQVHLWQVSKASQLKYYLVKKLQDNAFFTRFKIARRFLS